MPLRIRRRPRAVQDAEGIADYIAEDSLEAALRFLEHTESALQDLAESPGIGGLFESDQIELANLRSRRVHGFPNHVIFYFEHSDAIEVVHSSRRSRSRVGIEENLATTNG